MVTAYAEFVEFIAAGTTPRALVEFQPSEATKAKVADLIRREKSATLSPDETAELRHYLEIEHFMRLAKARARTRLDAADEMKQAYLDLFCTSCPHAAATSAPSE